MVSKCSSASGLPLMTSCSSVPSYPISSALRKMVGIPALIIVAFNVPMPGTSRSSIRLPVGNMDSPSADGSINSTGTSAAGKVTPSRIKSPVSCTSPLTIGTLLTMVLPILACQIRTSHTPFSGIRSASTRPLAIAKGPTADDKLPQLPLQSTKGLSIDT